MRAMVVGVLVVLVSMGCVGDEPPPKPPLEEGYVLEPVADGFSNLAQFTFTPDGRVLYSERLNGELHLLDNGAAAKAPWARVRVANEGEQGLLGVAVHPAWPQVQHVYAYYTYRDGFEFWNRLVRFEGEGTEPRVLLDRIPGSLYHNGGTVAIDASGHVWVTTGDGHDQDRAQDPDSLGAKVLRLTLDGKHAEGNPPGGTGLAYSLGHRNSFGIAVDPEGVAWITENGPDGNDEVNRLVAGGNYGWPKVMGADEHAEYQDPTWVWEEAVAPTGLAMAGAAYPDLEGDLVVGTWLGRDVRHLHLDAEGHVVRETLLATLPDGVVDVETGPDGHIYVATPHALYRLAEGAG